MHINWAGAFRLLKDDTDYSGSEVGRRGSSSRFGGISDFGDSHQGSEVGSVNTVCASAEK